MLTILLQDSGDAAAGIVSLIVFLIFCAIGLAVYFLPTVIAMMRNHPNTTSIMLVNLLLGWICIGWIVALVWSFSAIDQSKHYR